MSERKPLFRGTAHNPGGGVVTILLDRDTMEYPDDGTPVTVFLTAQKASEQVAAATEDVGAALRREVPSPARGKAPRTTGQTMPGALENRQIRETVPTGGQAPGFTLASGLLGDIERDAWWLHENVPDYSPDGVATLRDICREIAKSAFRAAELLR